MRTDMTATHTGIVHDTRGRLWKVHVKLAPFNLHAVVNCSVINHIVLHLDVDKLTHEVFVNPVVITKHVVLDMDDVTQRLFSNKFASHVTNVLIDLTGP